MPERTDHCSDSDALAPEETSGQMPWNLPYSVELGSNILHWWSVAPYRACAVTVLDCTGCGTRKAKCERT